MESRLPIHQKSYVHATRKTFFEDIIAALTEMPTTIDKMLGQGTWFVPPREENRIIDPAMGNLYLEFVFTPFSADGPSVNFAYSIYQIGSDMRIGILLRPTKGLHVDDSEFGVVWIGKEPNFLVRGDLLLWDWHFEERDLFQSWINQERYILGCRHMHFRVLDILARACVSQSLDSRGGGE